MYRTLIGACWCASALTAADLVEPPLYAAFEILPGTFRSTVTSRNGSFSGDDTVANLGMAAGIRYSLAAAGRSHGPVIGLETGVENAEFDTGSHRAAVLRLAASWAIAVDRGWVVLTGVRVGYGLSRLELGVHQGNDVSANGDGSSFEPNAEVVWGFSERGRLLMGAGWRSSSYRYAEDGLDIRVRNLGVTARLGFEWQFGPASAGQR